MELNFQLHLFCLYDGVPEGLLRLLLSGVPYGYIVPEKGALGDTTEAPNNGSMRNHGTFIMLLLYYYFTYLAQYSAL